MRTNDNYQMILDETDVVGAWLGGNNISSGVFEDISPINIYNEWCKNYDVDHVIEVLQENSSDNYVEECLRNWNMPDEYRELNIIGHLLSKTNNETEYQRVVSELSLYDDRGMLMVLKFLKYLVDVCDKHNIVLGVGRGSSVASYCLYLLGIHRINSIKYELDIKEFLK